MGFLEASYQRREEQLKEEAQLTKSYVDEKIQSLQNEKEDLVAGFKKKNELLEKNRITELERVRELHKKVRCSNCVYTLILSVLFSA